MLSRRLILALTLDVILGYVATRQPAAAKSLLKTKRGDGLNKGFAGSDGRKLWSGSAKSRLQAESFSSSNYGVFGFSREGSR